MEFDLLRSFLESRQLELNIQEVHVGGGSPTLLAEEDFDRLIERIGRLTDISKLREFSIEIDPRGVDEVRMDYYHRKGINRISFGVQDFEPDVQRAVHRIQPPELVGKLLIPEIRRHFHSVNFDIIWGLPRQTRESFRRTIDKVIELSPDRISLLYLHYTPDFKWYRHQRRMKPSELPDVRNKTVFFHEALEKLTENGYVRIGLDHFAKSTDALATALRDKTLHWNSLGYTTGRYLDIIGLGSGSSGRITDEYYSQNTYSHKEYQAALAAGRFPLFRGYRLTRDDRIRRDVILTLRCYFQLDFPAIEKRHEIRFREYFRPELDALRKYAADGMLAITDNGITISESGKHFTSLICWEFDTFNRGQEAVGV